MDKTGLNVSYGKIDGNGAKALPDPISGVRNLDTKDIGGAQAGTKTIGAFTHYKRRAEQVRKVGNNDDVFGSKCGSLRKGIETKRALNPLQPAYRLPGEGANPGKTEINDPYGNRKSAACVKRPSAMDAVNDNSVHSAVDVKSQVSGTSGKFHRTANAVLKSHSGSAAQKLDAYIS